MQTKGCEPIRPPKVWSDCRMVLTGVAHMVLTTEVPERQPAGSTGETTGEAVTKEARTQLGNGWDGSTRQEQKRSGKAGDTTCECRFRHEGSVTR